MNRVKIILGYILGFIAAIILTSFVALIILKVIVFNKNYVKDNLIVNNYYDKVSNEIKEKMENYMVSSGLPDTILNNLYSKEEIMSDINLFIDNAYKGEKTIIDSEKIVKRLNDNINKYLNDHKVKVTSQSYIDSFVVNMAKYYEQEVCFYGMLNGYLGYIPKIENIVNIGIIALLVLFVILIVSLVLLKVNFIGSVVSASGLIILFIRLLFYEKIDYKNILIISKNFSDMVKIFIDKIGMMALVVSIGLIICGLLINLIISYQKKPKNSDLHLKKA